MKTLLGRACNLYGKTVHGFEWFAPVSLLLFRLWVAVDFWRAGVVKVSDMNSTVSLFTSLYHVPLLPPVVAAYLGTAVELILPWLLGFGLFGRLTALFLFIYNIVAVISYPGLWPDGLWKDFWGSGFTDHKVWGTHAAGHRAFRPRQTLSGSPIKEMGAAALRLQTCWRYCCG